MAKALDPDIETNAAFRRANDSLQEQENDFYECFATYHRPWADDHYEVFCDFLDSVSVCMFTILSRNPPHCRFLQQNSVHAALDSFSS